MSMDLDLDLAVKRFKKAMESQVRDTPMVTKKGRTLYIVSDSVLEARELRRMDRMMEER
jgi:hypothetical protein